LEWSLRILIGNIIKSFRDPKSAIGFYIVLKSKNVLLVLSGFSLVSFETYFEIFEYVSNKGKSRLEEYSVAASNPKSKIFAQSYLLKI